MTRMYFVCVRLEIAPAKVEAFSELVRFNAANSRKEPGCLKFDVLRGAENPLLFRLHEVYRDEAAFKAHQQTAHYARWRAEIEALQASPRSSEKLHAFDLTP
jgi:(4S)-4-hydroxy-5-phosphonooxypentane-2,3-dione isomerase